MDLAKLQTSLRCKISPSLYQYAELDDGFQLYLGECSTIEGLALLVLSQRIVISHFGATCYRNLGWATKDDIPSLATVGSTIDFLESHSNPYRPGDDIGLIEFEAQLPGWGSLSTHDDGECTFNTRYKSDLIKILRIASPSPCRDHLIHKLLINPGVYITCSNEGRIQKYKSFKQYLNDSGSSDIDQI